MSKSLLGSGGGGGGGGGTTAAAFSRFAIGLGFAALPMPEANQILPVRLRVVADAGGAVLFAGVAEGGPRDLVRLGMDESLGNTEHTRG